MYRLNKNRLCSNGIFYDVLLHFINFTTEREIGMMAIGIWTRDTAMGT